MQHRLQRVEGLGADAQRLGERRRAGRDEHELLEVDRVLRVRAAVDDVHHRHRQRPRLGAAEPAVERHARLRGRRLRGRERDAEDRVRAEPPLFGVPSSSIIARSTARWSAASSPRTAPASSPLDVRDRLRHALAAVGGLAAVAQLDGLELPGRSAGRNGRAAERAGLEPHVDLDGRVAARVEDLAGVDVLRCALIGALLRLVEVAVLLVERELAEDPRPSASASSSARSTRSRKRCDVARKRELRVDVHAPRDVDGREEHVAELLEDVRVRLGLRRGLAAGVDDRLFQLAELVVEIAERAADVRILEVDRRRAPLDLAREEQRRAATPGRRGRCPRGPPARA